MEWARIGGVATVGLTALLILRAYKPEWAPFLRMAVTVVALGLTVALASTVLTYITDLASATGALEGEEWSLLLKALGVAFLTETAASVCRDSGETGLATWVETAGKLEILLLSFPLIRTVMDTVTELLGMA
jgi:stage III sporulation protein AD